MTDTPTGPTGSELAARAARLGREHGTPGRRTADRFESSRRERPSQPSMPATIPPRARSTDPITSHLAAAGVVGVSDRQAAVLEVLRTLGPLTDYELAGFYQGRVRSHGYPEQSPSGLRTRRRELTDAGLVVDTTLKRSNAEHGSSIVWGVA